MSIIKFWIHRSEPQPYATPKQEFKQPLCFERTESRDEVQGLEVELLDAILPSAIQEKMVDPWCLLITYSYWYDSLTKVYPINIGILLNLPSQKLVKPNLQN